MNDEAKKLLIDLDDEIDRKCRQIKEKRKEKIYQKLILLACILLLIIPVILVLLDINLLSVIIPVIIFFMFSTTIFSPAILNQ